MNLNFDNYISSKPFPYARKLLKDMGRQYHYVNEREVVDYLGYEIKTMTPDAYAGFGDVIGEIFDDTWAILLKQHNLILLSNTLSSRRERITLFHEIGHDILPWHQANSFSLRGKDIGPVVHNKIEREAFLAGTEIMYPLEHFIDDSLSLPLSFRSVKKLSDRYNGSFEATSIRYALTNQNIMAIAVVTENPYHGEKNKYINVRHKRQDMFPETLPSKKLIHFSTAPLRVQYCTRSYRFPNLIKSGTPVGTENIIYECWSQQSNKKGEIPASLFTSSARSKYLAKCIYDRETKKVFVLLWIPDRQLNCLEV